jgi:lipoate---protein ligase
MPAPSLLSLSFHDPAEILACDEAMLDLAEASDSPGFLRFFESPTHFVVLGYSKHLAAEVHEDQCRALNIPILRRCSGGGTVLQGPGCFNYSLVLPIDSWPDLETITSANRSIMERNRAAFSQLLGEHVEVQGHSDLTLHGLKFSGNAQRRKKRCLLYHGSLLLNFDLALISRVLKEPAQQPEYRSRRPHRDFLTNLSVPQESVRQKLASAWNATVSPATSVLEDLQKQTRSLSAKYGADDWTRRW